VISDEHVLGLDVPMKEMVSVCSGSTSARSLHPTHCPFRVNTYRLQMIGGCPVMSQLGNEKLLGT